MSRVATMVPQIHSLFYNHYLRSLGTLCRLDSCYSWLLLFTDLNVVLPSWMARSVDDGGITSRAAGMREEQVDLLVRGFGSNLSWIRYSVDYIILEGGFTWTVTRRITTFRALLLRKWNSKFSSLWKQGMVDLDASITNRRNPGARIGN
ncbi:hypothetical protein KC19_4G088400 [Ceratodon purpureus]|uniref:Uncharacterized protein n=1 Tax=Ceratodon purpureus TaxID=3225 RepID=A0A8T0I730_CERPU|nr:hypothetical protein KC19_4G088400 [Ceratodon purpureus]